MKADAVLTRRGAMGLAAMLSLVRPAPAVGGARGYLEGITSQVMEIHSFGEAICLDSHGLAPIGAAVGLSADQVALDLSAADYSPVRLEARRLSSQPAPWGWDTLENVR